MSESLVEKIKQKAKTPLEIEKYVKEWRETFRKGAYGNHRAYTEARDTRHFVDEEKWIPEKVVLKILEGHEITNAVSIELLNEVIREYEKNLQQLADLLKKRNRVAEGTIQALLKENPRVDTMNPVAAIIKYEEDFADIEKKLAEIVLDTKKETIK